MAGTGCLLCLVWFGSASEPRVTEPLTYLLAAFGFATNLAGARWNRFLRLSGSLMAALVAAAFLGPGTAFFVVLLSEVPAWAVERLRPIALPINILGIGAPAIGVGLALSEIFPAGLSSGPEFYAAFGVLAAVASLVNLSIVAGVHVLHDGTAASVHLLALRRLAYVWALNIAVTVAVASVYATVGLSATALLLLGLIAFVYQSHLVVRAEDRTRRYASLSWGVLAGMIRNLDMRDGRAARHSAAVARFSRDIATAAGLSASERELTHTAGLLHDVGKFALSDRVMERSVKLTEADWKAIKRHPDLGATMLQDLGAYGPVAEIVRAHHERLDGRGYPAGLRAEEIPEIAKIVAVAEVYDTLTADDSYRAKMSSFEALRELRRVAGSQLDPRYVEALAEALAGKDVDYRHAGAADFSEELALERRIGEAVNAGEPLATPPSGASAEAGEEPGPRISDSDSRGWREMPRLPLG